jgi:hypothetical protein
LHLRKLAASERDNALCILDELLPDDPDAREALLAAQRDVIGKTEPDFQVNALVGALARVVADQPRQIDELRDALRSKRTPAKAR